MQRRDLVERTKQFALRVVRLVAKLPKNDVGNVIGKQVLRSGTSIGANYREAIRSSTKKHFTSILVTALREADETLYWLELLSDIRHSKGRAVDGPDRRVPPVGGDTSSQRQESTQSLVARSSLLTFNILLLTLISPRVGPLQLRWGLI